MNTDVPYPQNALFHGSVGHFSELGLIRYGYLSASQTETLCENADMITTGNWIYPAKVGTDLFVVQVYQPENFDIHAFFDFGVYKSTVDSSVTIPIANPDMQYRKDAKSTFSFAIRVNSDINFVNVTAWEHPIKAENDLTVTQVAFTKQFEKKLEVG